MELDISNRQSEDEVQSPIPLKYTQEENPQLLINSRPE